MINKKLKEELNNKVEVKVKKLSEDAVMPKYAHDTDAGMDLTAVNYTYDPEYDCHIYGTGLALEIPEGYVGLVFPRSSNRKTEAYMCNHVGVIDSGYRGEIMVSFKNRDTIKPAQIPFLIKPYELKDRVGQIIIIPYPKVELSFSEDLSITDRGEQGHGSTGK
uniref:dUTP diphosphatase n=1 Tax=Geladintestivirus 2 TaxID=3233134 RepID=A0AAU8MIQ9_9CAUD